VSAVILDINKSVILVSIIVNVKVIKIDKDVIVYEAVKIVNDKVVSRYRTAEKSFPDNIFAKLDYIPVKEKYSCYYCGKSCVNRWCSDECKEKESKLYSGVDNG